MAEKKLKPHIWNLMDYLDQLDGRKVHIRQGPDRRSTEDIAAEVALILLDQHLRRGHR